MNILEILEKDYSNAVIKFNIFKKLHEIDTDGTSHLTDVQLDEYLSLKSWTDSIALNITEYHESEFYE